MYAECLRTRGFTVLTAETTAEAANHAGAADVIVTEIRVSGSFDGVDLVSRLRQAEATKKTPIIVLTACTFEPDLNRTGNGYTLPDATCSSIPISSRVAYSPIN